MNYTKNKTTNLLVRLSPEEKNYIINVAKQKNYHSTGDYVRTCCIRPLNVDDKLSSDFHKEINRIGNNFNQIARRVNSKDITDPELKQLLLGIMEELQQANLTYKDLK